VSLYLSTANKPSPKVIHRLARAFWIKKTLYVIKILFPKSTELRVRGLWYNVDMNTFDEFGRPVHTCHNCWELTSQIFQYADGFQRCLFCHQDARPFYLPGGILGVSTTEEDWF
jgi:hypothetical protein